MNWLLLIDMWWDWESGNQPPISWNASAERFEFLVIPPEGETEQIGIYMQDAFNGEDGVIDFEYQIDSYTPISGSPLPRINVIANSGTVVSSTEISDGATGRITMEAISGNRYAILISYGESDYYAGNFYGFEGVITPYQEAPPVTTVRPWWLCVPKDPPEPCPVRPTTFVDFANYDPDFKFPLQSSRKPSRIIRPDGCVVCAPTLIDQVEPEPEPPECEFPSPWRVEYDAVLEAYAIFVNDVAITYENYEELLPHNQNSFYITDAGVGEPGNQVMMRLRWGDFVPEDMGNFLFWLDDSFFDNMTVPLAEWTCLRGYLSYGEGWFQNPIGVINCCEEYVL